MLSMSLLLNTVLERVLYGIDSGAADDDRKWKWKPETERKLVCTRAINY